MKKITLFCVSVFLSSILLAQNLEVEGKAKIIVMDPASATAQPVARESDGTLSLMSASSSPYSIGDFAHGGVVCWVSLSGDHAKVVSIYEAGGFVWSNLINTPVGPAARSDINGAGNTVAIMMQSGHNRSAAQACADLAYGGYDDWYLPSKDELNDIYLNRFAINPTAVANGGEGLSDSFHWSSSEEDDNKAWMMKFINGDQTTELKDNNFVKVRAIRAF